MSFSLYFQRMTSNVSLCMALPIRPINDLECLVSRVLGSILIAVALLSIPFNVRYLLWSIYHGRHRSRQNLFIFSMIFSSMSVILVVLPSVFLQSFTCRRLCSPFYCQLEGFVSYLNGCVHMFLLMIISIIRYITVLRVNTLKRRFRRHSNLAVLACWLLGLVFAVPALFKWNRFVPEGLGFHCGLNWFDQSISSHIYLFSTMLFVYFIPLGVLSIVNTYVFYVIHQLVRTITIANERSKIPPVFIGLAIDKHRSPTFLSFSSTTMQSFQLKSMTNPNASPKSIPSSVCQTADPIPLHVVVRLNPLKIEQRFALATIFLVAEYLLSWTPYACMALLYLFQVTLIIEQPLLITICAFIAKVSMMINPFIYILAIRTNQLKMILFCRRCTCAKCRTR